METEAGAVSIDLGGGIVEHGGRIIKEGKVLDDLLEELEWMLLESDISSEAVHLSSMRCEKVWLEPDFDAVRTC